MDAMAEILIRAAGRYRTRAEELPGGVGRAVHVIAKVLRENLETGADRPMVGVRPAADPGNVTVYRHVEILGPSFLLHVPDDPLPGTEGRGVCYLLTRAPLRVHTDEESPCPPT